MTEKELNIQKALGLIPEDAFLYHCNCSEGPAPFIPDRDDREGVFSWARCLKCRHFSTYMKTVQYAASCPISYD
jgi:hypothetical protein